MLFPDVVNYIGSKKATVVEANKPIANLKSSPGLQITFQYKTIPPYRSE